jgi:transcription initiation factor TFIID subunit TAF12
MSKRKGGPGQEAVQAHAPAAGPADSKRLLHRTTLRELVKQTLGVDSVSPAVEELLLDVGDDFLEHLAAGAAALARHRGGNTLEAEDVRLHCERVWGLPLPGHGGDTVQQVPLSTGASGCVCVRGTHIAFFVLFLTRLVDTARIRLALQLFVAR